MSIEFTKTQEIAVHTSHSDILVSAGAGAGKTGVLVERFIQFVVSGKARVTEILTLTFTDKAANEMKRRIMRRFREMDMLQARRDLELAYISTLHAFAARLLKEHPVEAAVPPDFSVMEPEEAELLQDQALDELIETQCVPESDVFELLRIYGEYGLREGLKKILTQARTEGLSLTEFFARPRISEAAPGEAEGAQLFEKVGEPELAKEWKRFAKNTQWDWTMLEDFKKWSSGFNRKGGKDTKVYWKQIVHTSAQLMGSRLDVLAGPWREKFEKMALTFEAFYENHKFENSVLDFDDLQIRALELLTSQAPGNRKLLEHYRRQFKFVMVDEYQDVNPLQVKLVECFAEPASEKPIDKPSGKMFFVGDFKQSIYGFRGTSPKHFQEKQKQYQSGTGLLIEMFENFRTQKPILGFINAFFEKLWEGAGLENIGLIAQAKKEENPSNPELLAVWKSKEESIEQARMREAGAVARRMRELHETGESYGDMTVLFQAMTHAGIYEHALKNAGVPYFIVSGRGFYHQPEIRDMISLLSALENPLLDIPLTAALRSPFFHLSDEALFWLARYAKQENENTPLYRALEKIDSIAEIKAEEKLKIQEFRKFFTELISVKDRLYLSELLEWILQHTAYELPVLADRQGVRRYANLRKLVSLAREHESRERMPLGDFIRLVESLEAREIRESEAQVEAEESGRVVRLMTVHAAKGLEFPICFAADLAYQSRSPESRDFLTESGMGYSFKIPNELTGKMEKPGEYETLRLAADTREDEEWKRLFYVAVTRSRRKLILSGVHERPDEEKKEIKMNTWMDWVMAYAAELPLEVKEISEEAKGLVRQAPKILAEEETFMKLLKKEAGLDELFPKAKERAEFSARAEALYRRAESHEVPPGRVLDLPVSAYCAYAKTPLDYWRIYEMGYSDTSHEREMLPRSEEEIEEGSAAEFGTLIHKALELIDFKDPSRNAAGMVKEIFKGAYEKRRPEAEKILQGFFQSEVFKKLQSARKIYKEISFSVNERHGRIDGVMDVLFQDASGAWHILDYKTAVGDEKKVKEAAYDLQMGVYAAAVQEILGTVPQTAVLYFLKNQWSQTLEVSPAFMKSSQDRVKQMQKDIMEYRQKMMLRSG